MLQAVSKQQAARTANKPAGPPSAARRLAEQRAAAARERIAAQKRRHRLIVVASSVGVVLALVAALVIVKVVTGAGSPKSGQKASAANAALLAAVAGVPRSTFDTIGVGSASAKPIAISAPALTSGGKPELLYVGAEYCPYCAAERWAVAVALSRFGTLHGVGETTSSPSDVYPSTATLSFHGATLTSDYLSFVPKELQSNQVVNGQYTTLDTLDAQQQAIVDKYNASPYVSSAGSIPFIDIGGRYLISGASYSPQVLHGLTQAQIAADLKNPQSAVAKAIVGTANYVTAALCTLTHNAPSAVCSSAGVTAAASALGAKT
jgi:thiol-disulfide isomerase/thioredoxin